MPTTPRLAVVIPCFNCADFIADVLQKIPENIEKIYVVDDACPQKSAQVIKKLKNTRITLLQHAENQGVGAAMMTGYTQAFEDGMDIVIKIDGDGQMNPAHIPDLIAPLLHQKADYAKGNRFFNPSALKNMPKHRLFLNAFLSFGVKLASGFWGMSDPVNGYTAITRQAFENLDTQDIAPRYFFESSMLIALSLANLRVADVPIPAHYGEEKSQLRITNHLFDFGKNLLKGWIKRLWQQYFLYDFNMGSVYLLSGLFLLAFGFIFGFQAWATSLHTGIPRTTGTVMIAVLPLLTGLQLLLQAVAIDIQRGEKFFTLWLEKNS